MNLNDIKKGLYKQNPVANFSFIRKGCAHYASTINTNDTVPQKLNIRFEIPISDMGDADFTKEMDAKLLIRWIVIEN